jgi:hypothetical protein
MADLSRAEELVQTIERNDAFRAEVEAAPTATAKREVIDAHGFQDVGLDDMRAYVESKGGQLIVPEGGRELTEQELAAVAGGDMMGDAYLILAGAFTVGVAASAAV